MPKKPNISKKKRLAIGVSGSGTTFLAIAESMKQGELNMEIAFVFTDRECPAIEKAEKLGIKIVQRYDGEELNTFHERVLAELRKKAVNIVALAGYLRLFPITGNDEYLVLNSHPAAIPYFGGPGMWGHHVHEAVIKWAKETNFAYPYTYSTVHIASAEYDKGRVLGVKRCKIERDDDPISLAARLLPVEHQNYIAVLKKFAGGEDPEAKYQHEFLTLVSLGLTI